jgi:hypothetical protein
MRFGRALLDWKVRIDNKKMGLYQNEKAPFITELHKINYNIFQTSFLFTIFALKKIERHTD